MLHFCFLGRRSQVDLDDDEDDDGSGKKRCKWTAEEVHFCHAILDFSPGKLCTMPTAAPDHAHPLANVFLLYAMHSQDEKLRKAVKSHNNKNWKKIAATAFPGTKTDVQCLHR